MVERKKTGRAKARKGVSSSRSYDIAKANMIVHLGQALIGPVYSQHAYTFILVIPLAKHDTAQSTSPGLPFSLFADRLRASSSANLSSSSFLSFASLSSRLGFLKKAE
jgi:hypothetical protein